MENLTVEKLKEEANSEHTFYTEFVLSYNSSSKKLYCFYEGYDDTKYYSVRVKNITSNNEYDWFYCAGKDNVLKSFELINNHKEYDLDKILFFIDKDFSEKAENNYVYCTPYYSIENFYTNQKVLETILNEEFKLKQNTKDFNTAIELYKKLVVLFHKETIFFNSWLSCQNEMRIKKNEIKRLHIDDKVKRYFKNIVSADLKSISDFSDLKNLEFIENLFPNAYKLSLETINKKIKELEKINGTLYFRGKFELKFFVSYLNRLKNELGVKKSLFFSKKYKIDVNLVFSSIISSLSQYANTTECLRDYLIKYKNTA